MVSSSCRGNSNSVTTPSSNSRKARALLCCVNMPSLQNPQIEH